MTNATFVELVAETYMHGGSFALDEHGISLLIVPDTGLPQQLIDDLRRYGPEVRGIVLAGIATALDGWQPTLTGLEQLEGS